MYNEKIIKTETNIIVFIFKFFSFSRIYIFSLKKYIAKITKMITKNIQIYFLILFIVIFYR